MYILKIDYMCGNNIESNTHLTVIKHNYYGDGYSSRLIIELESGEEISYTSRYIIKTTKLKKVI